MYQRSPGSCWAICCHCLIGDVGRPTYQIKPLKNNIILDVKYYDYNNKAHQTQTNFRSGF